MPLEGVSRVSVAAASCAAAAGVPGTSADFNLLFSARVRTEKKVNLSSHEKKQNKKTAYCLAWCDFMTHFSSSLFVASQDRAEVVALCQLLRLLTLSLFSSSSSL